jgi:hypothetical protein
MRMLRNTLSFKLKRSWESWKGKKWIQWLKRNFNFLWKKYYRLTKTLWRCLNCLQRGRATHLIKIAAAIGPTHCCYREWIRVAKKRICLSRIWKWSVSRKVITIKGILVCKITHQEQPLKNANNSLLSLIGV